MTEASSSSQQAAKQVKKENRQIITPYAFQVSPELFGIPLASPIRRGLAISVDLFLIALLSDITGNVLAVLSAALLLFVSQSLKRKHKPDSLVNLLRGLSLFLVVLAAFSFYEQFENRSDTPEPVEESENILATLALGAKYLIQANNIPEKVSSGVCESNLACWDQLATELSEDIVSAELTALEANALVEKFIELNSETLSSEQAQKLNKKVLEHYNQEYKPTESPTKVVSDLTSGPAISDPDESKYSVVNWMRGLADDFGIGFGWAALYFTALTGLFKGQTLGKKLLGIKIIKLDGSVMSTWESFERYGGYGAGLATGLMGFLQVFWDPNRQAIQDKICKTLVIDIGASRQPKLNKMIEE